MIETERLRAEQADVEEPQLQLRKADMHKLADAFEGAVGEIVEMVSSAATELEASANTLTTTAERSQELATMVAAASEEASTNVQAVASASEELTTSVSEISRQVQESSRVANEAVDQAQKTNDRVGELSKAAARIGDVVELINTIAGQTNLLALNATIDAARAGAAGRRLSRPAAQRHPGRDPGLGERDQGNQRHHREIVRNIVGHRCSGGTAGCGGPGNFPQRAAGGAWHPAGLVPHHRRAAWRRGDRIGLVAGSLR